MQKLLDLLFGEDDGTSPDAVSIFIIETPMPADPVEVFTAILLGLEDEEVHRYAMSGPIPPEVVTMALARPSSQVKWDPRPGAPVCFDTVEFRLFMQRDDLAWYQRITPPFREES